jgi:acetyltransferase-like isoleucine patch superfamily enzyme
MREYLPWRFLFRQPRILLYKLLSNNKRVQGRPFRNQPALLIGKGRIIFGKNVHLGYYPSPFFYNGYVHLESRSLASKIVIGDNVLINNNFFAVSAGEGIYIGDNTLIGINCEIIDSDFHCIPQERRRSNLFSTKKIEIGKNVFVGNNVKITKGVTLGDNVVVGNGAVVNSSFEDNVIIGGVPAKIIGKV